MDGLIIGMYPFGVEDVILILDYSQVSGMFLNWRDIKLSLRENGKLTIFGWNRRLVEKRVLMNTVCGQDQRGEIEE